MSGTCDPRPFIRHMLLADAWVRFNSRTGRVTERQVSRTMARLSADDLRRMLTACNALPEGCEAIHSEVSL